MYFKVISTTSFFVQYSLELKKINTKYKSYYSCQDYSITTQEMVGNVYIINMRQKLHKSPSRQLRKWKVLELFSVDC